MRQGVIGLLVLLVGCASASPPPGGPEDKAPPQLVRVTPDTNAVNVKERAVTFFFDETINDRGTGAQELDQFFLVSPSDGAPRIEWHRSRIDVRPRHAFRANTAYTVTLLPGLGDLRSNVMKTGASIVFSTGPTIPPDKITGVAFDWPTERGAPRALIEAMSPDSIVYLAQSDSVGRFAVGPMPPGSYLVRVILDQNGNRALDRNEAFDTVRVIVPHPAPIELLAVQRDTLPARLLTVEATDSVSLKVTFDRLIDPSQPLAAAAFRLVSVDSTVIPITAALTPRQERDVAVAAAQAALDSTRRADSIAGKPIAPVLRPVAPPAATPAATKELPPPTSSRPAPSASIALKLGARLAPNAPYRLSVAGIRALSGRTQPSERSFTTPKPPPPKPAADSARTTPPAPKTP